jgi:hypothetical protein
LTVLYKKTHRKYLGQNLESKYKIHKARYLEVKGYREESIFSTCFRSWSPCRGRDRGQMWGRTEAGNHTGLPTTFQKVSGTEQRQAIIQDFLPHFRRYMVKKQRQAIILYWTSYHISEGMWYTAEAGNNTVLDFLPHFRRYVVQSRGRQSYRASYHISDGM